jgi:hypothetical protein
MNPITLTNPTDPTISWTSGKRGPRPAWVVQILETDPTLLPKKEAVVAEKVSLTNPHTGATWESGKGGMKPKWVQEMLDGKVPSLVVLSEAEISKALKPNAWVMTGGMDEDTKVLVSSRVRCFVYAVSELEAMRELNQAFIYPVTKLEFESKWKPVHVDEAIHHNTPGVYQGIHEGWTKRSIIKK